MPLIRGQQVISRQDGVPSPEELRQQAEDALKIKNHKDYLQMKRDGELGLYLALKVKVVQDCAQSLIQTGTPELLAWKEAIYQEIYQSPA